MYFTQKDRCTQRVALIINMVLGGVSLIAFVLSFWDVNSQVVLWIGFLWVQALLGLDMYIFRSYCLSDSRH